MKKKLTKAQFSYFLYHFQLICCVSEAVIRAVLYSYSPIQYIYV